MGDDHRMGDIKKFYEESLHFNWDMLEQDSQYYINLTSMTTFQKLDELYDMFVYFMEIEEYEKCSVIQQNILTLREQYHQVIREKKSI